MQRRTVKRPKLATIRGVFQPLGGCFFAFAARTTKCTLAAKYRSLMVRKSHKKAIIAIAHKMIRLILMMLSRRQP